MSTTQELIERLYADVMYDAFGDVIVPSVLTEAADRLASLSAENAALKAKLAGVETALTTSPLIESITPSQSEWTNCWTVQDTYDLMKSKIRAAIAAYLAAVGG